MATVSATCEVEALKLGTATITATSVADKSKKATCAVIAVKPVGYTGSTSWNDAWQGDPTTENVAAGTGDPCKYYLGETWSLPTEEYKTLFNSTETGWAGATGWSWTSSPASATHTSGLTFPTSGYREYVKGDILLYQETGCYWSNFPSPINEKFARHLLFDSFTLTPGADSDRTFGFPVRCVRD